MPRTLTTGVLAAALSAPVLSHAQSDASELEVLRAQMAEMQAKLAAMEGASSPTAESMHLDAATDAALRDAAERISYQDDSIVAGHNGKEFFLSDPEENFYWSPNAQIQFRYIYNMRDNSGGDDNQQGFQLRRFKLKGDGWIADPNLEFKYSVEFNRDSNVALVEEAVIAYDFGGVAVRGGRYKGPFAFDELMSSSRQMAVERALVTEQFTTGKMEGVGLKAGFGDNGSFQVMLSDGAGGGEGGNGDFNESSADFAVTARADVVLGNNKIVKDYTSWGGDEQGINIGAAVHHEVGQTGDGQTAAALDSFTRVTGDVLFNAAGLSLFGAAYLETQEAPDGTAESDPFGFLAQAGYNIDDTFEPFVRYEFIDPDTGGDEISLITAGFNIYQKKHAAKFTLDVVFALDPLNGIGVSDGLGLQTDAADEDGQTAIRAQYQLLF
jgi:hypothetical protein